MKRTMSLLLTAIMILCLVPLNAITAFATNTAKIKVENVSATPDSTVDVTISITDNPGIASIGLTLSFDEALTLIGATNGDAFSDLTMTPPAQLKKVGSVSGSCRFAWLGNENATDDGVILNLRFKVSENAELNKDCVISLVCESGDVLDESRNTVNVTAENGKITVIDYTPGDVDGTGTINMMDVLTLCQYYVDGCQYDPDGYAINLNPECGDVDANGKVNMMDVLMICQYYVDGCKYDPDGYAVRLMPGKKSCDHTMEHISAKLATCTENGNIEYWYCAKCGEYFSDIDASNVISLESTVVKSKGHDLSHISAISAQCESDGNIEYWQCGECKKMFRDSNGSEEIDSSQTIISCLNHPIDHRVIDQAESPDYEKSGLTEGEHCDLCGKVLKEQQVIPKLENTQYAITYKNLKSAENNNNPTYYWRKDGLSGFENPGSINGYTFAGWFTEENGGIRVNNIPAGNIGEVVVYAHWNLVKYSINYICGDSGINSANNPTEYTIESSINLSKATSTDRYKEFSYWLDENNKKIEKIESLTGNITLTARYKWVSMRNMVTPYSKMLNPVYAEKTLTKDKENNIYYFTYYLGRIDNIVVNSSMAKEYTGTGTESLVREVTEANSTTIAESVTKTVSDVDTWQKTFSESFSETISSTVTASAEAEYVGMKASVSASISASATSTTAMSETDIKTHSVTNSNSSTESFTVTSQNKITDTKTWDITCPTGYYRLSKVCSADVFAVVIYSVDDNTFHVETFNIVNDDFTSMWDYSEDGTFAEGKVDLPFEAPIGEITSAVISILDYQSEIISVSFNKDNSQMNIDLSACQNDGNLNNTSFPWLKDGIFTVYPNLGNIVINTVKIIGNFDAVDTLINSFSIKFADTFDACTENVILENVGVYTTNEEGFMICGDKVNVLLTYIGKNEIRAHDKIEDVPEQIAIIANDLTINSADELSTLSVYGGNGSDAELTGGAGIAGSAAINCINLSINAIGKTTIVGGSGGDGKEGSDGKVASSYSSSGTAGKNGGNGGAGGHAIIVQTAQIITPSSTYLYGGNGGKGGNGGNGGNGVTYQGQGPTNIHDDPGNGGAAGSGGNGGNGGNTGLLYDLGNGSCGGIGGIGGSKGMPGVAGCFWWDPWIGSNQYWYGKAGSEGTNGSNGTNGI